MPGRCNKTGAYERRCATVNPAAPRLVSDSAIPVRNSYRQPLPKFGVKIDKLLVQAEGTVSLGKYDCTRVTTSGTAVSRPSCTSQIDTMGKNFVKSMYRNIKVAPNPMVMATSTHVGE